MQLTWQYKTSSGLTSSYEKATLTEIAHKYMKTINDQNLKNKNRTTKHENLQRQHLVYTTEGNPYF